jgi:hypothetical protein
MTIRVNDVTMMKIAGARERTVNRARICRTTAVCLPPPWPRSIVSEGPSAYAEEALNRQAKTDQH